MMQHRGYAQQIAGPVGTTWSPTDITSFVTLSAGNTVATDTDPSAFTVAHGVRATGGRNAGKLYFEVTEATTCQVGDWMGLANIGYTLATTPLPGGGASGVTLDGFSLDVRGNAEINGNGSALPIWAGGAGSGQTWSVAVDFGGGLLWVKPVAGTGSTKWNNDVTALPDTGVGGLTISFASGALYPYARPNHGAAASGPAVFTLNTGASAFLGTLPSGFSAWG